MISTENKKPISIRIDVDDLNFLKSRNPKYQRLIQLMIKDWIMQEKEFDKQKLSVAK